jgi:hypothetical protein
MNVGIAESVFISLVAVAGAVVNAVLAVRARGCDRPSAVARMAVACVELAIGALVFFRLVSPTVGYGLLCLSLVSVYLFNLLREERTRRRRVASLTPRPAADAIPACWVAIAGLSLLMLAPYVLLGEERSAALMVGSCALIMSGIAWRIASAPIQLAGANIEGERIRNRASRSRSAGLTAVLAVGSIFVFISFANAGLPAVLPLQHTLLLVSFITWAGMWAWVALYWRHLCGRLYLAP